ncbi:NAD(P)-dependent oxidoreductase [Candidatus Saganbacteria bacterium CG08_land_8_20_14_0_20_45_16]|uniref:NAD(P)-dependent oxidoreductase n=1 Tax=Candidatus Saganbacteria bacterium CG08_land_8_20_14_0_20_45_16 TaxID=2014293 RepID=A0A2H0XUW4_UNCSA|nr:MAG: NAD(P)-dependent oxidoreductase [Candidatus Saganbacteria bacterium CG08_land_8_20_14_0_20_45_16]
MKETRILVTGGSGFIGTNMINRLQSEGYQKLLNIDIKPPREEKHRQYWHECDILDLEKLQRTIQDFQPELVVHLAAKTGLTRANLDCYAENTTGVKNMIAALRATPTVKRAVFTSTLLVCQMGYIPQNDTDYKPSTLYGESKVIGEKIVREQKDLNFDWIIIRPISIWGPWGDEPYINFFRSIKKGWYFHIGSGHYRRSLGYVENAVYSIYILLTAEQGKVRGKTFYIADYGPADLYDMAAEIRDQLKARRIFHLPLTLAKFIAKIGDIFRQRGWENVPLQSFRLNNILTEYVFDMNHLKQVIGEQPFSLKQGVSRTINWLRQSNGF